jgi:hypothetical protein
MTKKRRYKNPVVKIDTEPIFGSIGLNVLRVSLTLRSGRKVTQILDPYEFLFLQGDRDFFIMMLRALLREKNIFIKTNAEMDRTLDLTTQPGSRYD